MKELDNSLLEHDAACEGDCKACEEDCTTYDADRQTMTITTDDDREIECSVINIFRAKDKQYIVLFPTDGSSDGEAFLYGFQQDAKGNPHLENIEDEEEYSFAASVFENLIVNASQETYQEEE